MELEPTRKLVLLAYADHARADGTHVYPSIARIAEKTGFSRRWIQSLTHELAEAGLLIGDGSGPRGQNRWRIALSSPQATPAPPAPETTSGAKVHARVTVPPAPTAAVGRVADQDPGVSPSAHNAPPSTGARSSPVHSSTPWSEAHLTPGARPSSPEPSVTIKEPPITGAMQESESGPAPAGAGPPTSIARRSQSNSSRTQTSSTNSQASCQRTASCEIGSPSSRSGARRGSRSTGCGAPTRRRA